MAIAWKCILILLYAAPSVIASLPRISAHLTTSNLTASAQTNDTIHSTPNTALQIINTATRQLVGHYDLLHIQYATQERLPSPLYHDVIETSLRLAAEMVRSEGDDAPFPHRNRFVHLQGNVLLMAEHAHHSSSEDLTWGVLFEALEVVQRFMRSRPFHLEAEILGGLDGRGFPVGEIVVKRWPLEVGWRENATTV